MDYLISIVKSLSQKETSAVIGKIKNQKLKLRLFNLISEKNSLDNKSIKLNMSYNESSNSIYTLKKRLLDDILNVKKELTRNEISRIREDVDNLFPLLMNGDNILLIRELKRLEKSALKQEMYAELRDIYFCYSITTASANGKAGKYQKQIENTDKRLKIMHEVEKLFYPCFSTALDFFYYADKKMLADLNGEKDKMHIYTETLQNNTSKFYLINIDLLLHLSVFFDQRQSADIFRQLHQFSRFYRYSFLKQKFPGWEIALECLYLRYHYLNGDYSLFMLCHKNLYPSILKTADHYLLDKNLFLYIYLGAFYHIEKRRIGDACDFIEKLLKESRSRKSYEGLNAHYYLYLGGLNEYYLNNHTASISILMRAKEHFKKEANSSGWIIFEIILLNLMNGVRLKDYQFIDSEINSLRRHLKKYPGSVEHLKAFNRLTRTLKEYEKKQDMSQLETAVTHFKNQTRLMRLFIFA